MLLDKLLSNLAVHVEPFALCTLSAGWRLRLPAPPDAMIHFVLQGHGAVRGPDNDPHSLAPLWLAVVPHGAAHALESGTNVQSERRIDTPPRAALYYSCIARGPNLFGQGSVELTTIADILGDVPLIGFFANGEISNNRLYGYTGVLSLIL